MVPLVELGLWLDPLTAEMAMIEIDPVLKRLSRAAVIKSDIELLLLLRARLKNGVELESTKREIALTTARSLHGFVPKGSADTHSLGLPLTTTVTLVVSSESEQQIMIEKEFIDKNR